MAWHLVYAIDIFSGDRVRTYGTQIQGLYATESMPR